MSQDKPTELQSPVPGLEFPAKDTQRDCGHFCEACARRDDRVTRLLGLLDQATELITLAVDERFYLSSKIQAEIVLAKIEKEKA